MKYLVTPITFKNEPIIMIVFNLKGEQQNVYIKYLLAYHDRPLLKYVCYVLFLSVRFSFTRSRCPKRNLGPLRTGLSSIKNNCIVSSCKTCFIAIQHFLKIQIQNYSFSFVHCIIYFVYRSY